MRASGSRIAILGTVVLAMAWACASAPPPQPTPPDPAEETLAALTQALNLDAAQQKRTHELLKEMADRDDAIRAGWSKRKKVRPDEIAASRLQFQQDFFVILTPEQKRLFIENRARAGARVH